MVNWAEAEGRKLLSIGPQERNRREVHHKKLVLSLHTSVKITDHWLKSVRWTVIKGGYEMNDKSNRSLFCFGYAG